MPAIYVEWDENSLAKGPGIRILESKHKSGEIVGYCSNGNHVGAVVLTQEGLEWVWLELLKVKSALKQHEEAPTLGPVL